LLKQDLGTDVEITGGSEGEFTVWVQDKVVAKKGLLGFPGDQKVLAAVRAAIKS